MTEQEFAPLFGDIDQPTESELQYVRRVSPLLPNFPADVLGQWLYDHWHQASDYYDFLDWHRVSFTLDTRPTELVQRSNLGNDGFVRNLQPYFLGQIEPTPRLERIRAYFAKHGTWPRPVIFLENEPPIEHCAGPTWGRPLHLVEGHHRVAAFLAFRESGRVLAEQHQVWLLRQEA